MSECGYIDCCPVPDKNKRIEELEEQVERYKLALKTCQNNCTTHELNETKALEQLDAEERATGKLALEGGRMYTRIEQLEAQLTKEIKRSDRAYAVMNEQGKYIKKLQAQVAEAIKWIQKYCPFDSDDIRNALENDARAESRRNAHENTKQIEGE